MPVPRAGQNGYFHMTGSGWMMRLVIYIAHMTGATYRVTFENENGTLVSEVYNDEDMRLDPPSNPNQQDPGVASH